MKRRVHGRPRPTRPDTEPLRRAALLSACWSGEEPAESLPPEYRDQFVIELWAAGWTDVEVASLSGWSTYTAARIRERLGLQQNTKTRGAA